MELKQLVCTVGCYDNASEPKFKLIVCDVPIEKITKKTVVVEQRYGRNRNTYKLSEIGEIQNDFFKDEFDLVSAQCICHKEDIEQKKEEIIEFVKNKFNNFKKRFDMMQNVLKDEPTIVQERNTINCDCLWYLK